MKANETADKWIPCYFSRSLKWAFRMQLEWVWLPLSSVKWLLTRSRILEGNYMQNTLEATQMLSSTVYRLDFWISSFSFFLYIILVSFGAYTSLPHFTNIHLYFFFILKKCLRIYCAVSLRIYLYIGFYILLHLYKTIIFSTIVHILNDCILNTVLWDFMKEEFISFLSFSISPPNSEYYTSIIIGLQAIKRYHVTSTFPT